MPFSYMPEVDGTWANKGYMGILLEYTELELPLNKNQREGRTPKHDVESETLRDPSGKPEHHPLGFKLGVYTRLCLHSYFDTVV